MTITNGYATLAEVKARLSISDTTDDTTIEAVIESASRAIDGVTGRVFYATAATARYFTADDATTLFLDDDLLSVDSLVTDHDGDRTYEVTWATTDYDLIPFNRTPYTRIAVAPNGTNRWPAGIAKGVKITGSWGYNATGSYPDAINEAAIILATRFFKRKDAPFGVLGTPEMGMARITAVDPDVRLLLRPYIRMGIALA